MEVLFDIFNFLTTYKTAPLLAISAVIFLGAISLGIKHYGKEYLNKLIHKRNLCWLIAWLISLSIMFVFCHTGIFTRCPLWITIILFLIYFLFTFTVFFTVHKLLFFTKWYIKKYDNFRKNGHTFENKRIIEKRPWFFLDANERIEYELLKSHYQKELGNLKGAFDTLSNAEKLPMYPEETLECDISRVYILIELGNVKKARQLLNSVKTQDHPAYCFLESYILENEGKLDEAFAKAQEAENSIDVKYNKVRVKQGLFNHLGRLYCFKNNPTEVFRYFKLAIKEAEIMQETSLISITYNNLISQYLNYNQPQKDVLDLVNKYTSQLDPDSINTICETINLKVRISKFYNDKSNEELSIRQGYKELVEKSSYPELAIQRIQILHMLYSGGFDLEPVLSDVEKDILVYDNLKLPQKPWVYISLAHFIRLPQNGNKKYIEKISSKVFEYLNNNAIDDINSYYESLSSDCVYERCNSIGKKIDVYVLLGKNTNQQLSLLKDLKQIYKENNNLLKEAHANTEIVKFYAQQCQNGYILTSNDKKEINTYLNEAINLSYNIPWVYLGDLLINIACAYDFLQEDEKVRQIILRFNDLGLKTTHCNFYSQQSLKHLKEKYHL